MGKFTGSMKKKLFGLAAREVDFQFRGFHHNNPKKRDWLEQSGGRFVHGFNLALEFEVLEDLTRELEQQVPAGFRGFAYEGAGMALYLLDLLTPWNRNRFQQFLEGPGHKHYYMALIGAGWAMARLCRNFERKRRGLDPFWSWLMVDGYGFHEGFFKPQASFVDHKQPRDLEGYGYEVFDQGLGRAMWFYCCADVPLMIDTLKGFPEERQPALWAGVGLACTYAGGVEKDEIETLKEAAGEGAAHLAQGCAFACKARERAENPVPHNELAAEVFCGLNAGQAAKITDDTLGNWPETTSLPHFEIWRTRIREAVTVGRVAP